MDEIAQFISTVGFPVAVAAFLLWRMNGKLDKMTKALEALTRLNRASLRHTIHQHRRERDLEPSEESVLAELENGEL